MASANSVNTAAQASSFKTTVKKRLVDLDISVTALAQKIGVSRNAASIAINHETMFPGIKQRIREALGL